MTPHDDFMKAKIANLEAAADKYHLDVNDFINFWDERFPDNVDPQYMRAWAERIHLRKYHLADYQTRRALENNNLVFESIRDVLLECKKCKGRIRLHPAFVANTIYLCPHCHGEHPFKIIEEVD